MNENNSIVLGEKEEAADFVIERKDNLANVLEDGWIPCLLDKIGMPDETHVYIRRVGSHLEIGAAQVNFIR